MAGNWEKGRGTQVGVKCECENVCFITKLPNLHEPHLHHTSHGRTWEKRRDGPAPGCCGTGTLSPPERWQIRTGASCCARHYSRQREQAVHTTSLFLRSLESPHSLTEGWDAPGIPIMVPCVQNCINVRAQVWLGWSATLRLGAFQPPRDLNHPPILSQSSFLSKGSLPSQPKNHVPPNFPGPFSTHPFSITFSEKRSAFTAFSSSPWLHSNSGWLNGTLH